MESGGDESVDRKSKHEEKIKVQRPSAQRERERHYREVYSI